MLFEVALIQQPTTKEKEEGKREKLILSPTPVIADSDKAAGIVAVQNNAEKLNGIDLSNVEVLVRPFAVRS